MSPNTFLVAGVLTYLVTITANRFLGERNYRILSQEDKVKLVDAFSFHRSWATYLPIGIMLVAFALAYANPSNLHLIVPVGLVLVLLTSLLIQYSIIRRVSELSLPAEYVARFRIQALLVSIGSVVAAILLAYPFVTRGS